MLAVVMTSIAAIAQSQGPVSPTTVTVKKQPEAAKPTAEKTLKVNSPFINFNPLKPHPESASDKVFRVDGISSQPWYRMAGARPGWSAFPEPGQGAFGFNLFWVGAEPRR
jgi:hypothetical protein